jgi:TonB family protein
MKNQFAVSRAVLCALLVVLSSAIPLGCGSDTAPLSSTNVAPVMLASRIAIDPLDSTHVDRLPRFVKLVLPPYPPMAQQIGLEGTAWVRVSIDESGEAHNAQVYESSGTQSLDDATVHSANKCRYLPARYHGRNVAVRVIYAVDFKLVR